MSAPNSQTPTPAPLAARPGSGTATVRFTAGILRCWQVRDYLEARRFEGLNIEWREGRGWIEREWIVRGDTEDVLRVWRALAWREDESPNASPSATEAGR